MTIRIYTASNCPPCKHIDKLLEQGRLPEDVEVINIETDEGFLRFKEEVLNKGDGAVPSAYKEGKQCKLGYDDQGDIAFDCPKDDSSSSE